MKFIAISALSAVALTGLVSAQAGVPQCVLNCSTQAASAAGCTSFADLTCVCTSADFQNAAGACLTANCTAEEQATGLALQQGLCQGQSVTSGTVTATVSSGGSASVDVSAIASLTASGASLTSAASSAASSASAAASATASSASGASQSGGASPTSGNPVSAASSVVAASPTGAAGKVELSYKGLGVAAFGAAGVILGGAILL